MFPFNYLLPFPFSVEACDDSGEFFAECIHKCLDGMGTDDVCLIRIIVSRSEVRTGQEGGGVQGAPVCFEIYGL